MPDVSAREPVPFANVRDPGEWLVALLEPRASGAVNATGPLRAPRCDWPMLIEVCQDEARARGLTRASSVPVGADFLVAPGVQPWSELPLWRPSKLAEYHGFSRAATSGLRTRPLRETVSAVIAEGVPANEDRRRAGKLSREREAQVLVAWRRWRARCPGRAGSRSPCQKNPIQATPVGAVLIEPARRPLFEARCLRRDMSLHGERQLGYLA